MFLDGQWNAVALANQGEIQPWHIQLPVKSGAYLTTKLQDLQQRYDLLLNILLY